MNKTPDNPETSHGDNAWQTAEALLGKTIGTHRGADAVEAGSIRRQLEAIEFDCPLHHDQQIARQSGYEGIIAPNHMILGYALPAYWQPGDRHTRPDDPVKAPPYAIMNIPTPCQYAFATDAEIEFFAPMYIGDEIRCEDRLVSIIHKTTSLGRGAFMTQESTYRNQRGEVVAIMRSTLLRYNPNSEGNANE